MTAITTRRTRDRARRATPVATDEPRTETQPMTRHRQDGGTKSDHLCGHCGDPAETPAEPVDFRTGFRYYVLTPTDPGQAPTGTETVHAATNKTDLARIILNTLNAQGVTASGWDNQTGTWFLTPEIMDAMRSSLPRTRTRRAR